MQEAVGGGWEWGRNSGKGNPAMKCVEEGGATKPATQCAWETVQNACLGMTPWKMATRGSICQLPRLPG